MRRGPTISVPGAQFSAALIPPNRSVGINGPVVLGTGATFGFGAAGAWMKAGTGRIDGPQGVLAAALNQHCVVLSAVVRPTAASVTASNVFGAQRFSDKSLAFALMTGDGTNARFTFDAAGATLWQDPQDYVVGDVSTVIVRAWKPSASANGFVSIWVNGRLALDEGAVYAGASFAPANSLVVTASNAASAEVYLGSVVVGANGWRPGNADLLRASFSPNSLRDWLFSARRVFLPVVAAAGASMPAGLAAETDTAQSLAGRQARPAGLAVESDSALAPTGRQLRVAGMAAEADTAMSLASPAPGGVGVASETDTAQSLSGRQARAVGMAVETGVALALGGVSIRSAGLSLEIDAAFARSAVQRRSAGRADEASQALALLPGLFAAPVGMAIELDMAYALGSTAAAIVEARTLRILAETRTMTIPIDNRHLRVI